MVEPADRPVRRRAPELLGFASIIRTAVQLQAFITASNLCLFIVFIHGWAMKAVREEDYQRLPPCAER